MKKYNELLNVGVSDISSLVHGASFLLGVPPERIHVEFRILTSVTTGSNNGKALLPDVPNSVYFLVGILGQGHLKFLKDNFSFLYNGYDASKETQNLTPQSFPVGLFFDTVQGNYSLATLNFQISYLQFSVI